MEDLRDQASDEEYHTFTNTKTRIILRCDTSTFFTSQSLVVIISNAYELLKSWVSLGVVCLIFLF
jgi:hypothetical protein